MLNKFYDYDCRTEINYPSTINKVEKRAPTDDSIRLAKEYEDKITSKIIGNITFGNNGIDFPKGNAVIFEDDLRSWAYFVIISFRLNGKFFERKMEISKLDIMDAKSGSSSEVDQIRKIYKLFVDKISEEISKNIMSQSAYNFEEMYLKNFKF